MTFFFLCIVSGFGTVGTLGRANERNGSKERKRSAQITNITIASYFLV